MTRHLHTTPARHRPRLHRRGSAYILVLGASTIILVVGLSVAAISRAQLRASSAGVQSSQAAIACASGPDIAVELLNDFSSWRTNFGNAGSISGLTIGSARLDLDYIDPADGLLWNDVLQPLRVYCTATVGTSRRICSVQLEMGTRVPWPVLASTLHSANGTTVQSGAQLTSINGPVTSKTTVTVLPTGRLNGSASAPVVVNLGTLSGTLAIGAPTLPSPGTDAWNTLSAQATNIPYSSLSGDRLDKCVLSPGTNPFGPVNAAGIYRIDVPSDKNFQIKDCRIDATLLVFLNNKATIKLQEEISWDARARGVALLIRADLATSEIFLEDTTTPVSEDRINANFNPPGSPYSGQTDADELDVYPAGVRGLIHVMGRGPVTVDTGFALSGCLLVDSTISVKGDAIVHADPALTTSPPLGYEGVIFMKITPGSFRWETEETRSQAIAAASALAGSTPAPVAAPSSYSTLVAPTTPDALK